MPKVSDSYLETKREQLLDAAVSCFARNGFAETTIEDICREAGVSHGTVYRYFQSKEDIVEASFRREQDARIARYSEAMQQSDPSRVLESYLSIYFQRRIEPEAETIMKFRMQLYGESVRNPRMGEIQRRGREEMLGKAVEVIRSAQNEGRVNPHLDALAVARVVAALADGIYVQRSVTPDLDVEKCLEAVKAIFWGNLWVPQKQEASDGEDRS